MQMTQLPKRKQIRLKDYDYSQNGFYFITICTKDRKKLFGMLVDGKINLNDIGNIVDFTWNDLINHNNIKLHQYVIMPNHIHGIIEICNRRADLQASKIPEIIRQFKTFSSKRINEYLKRNGREPFSMKEIWQKSYYEHIIRNEDDYLKRVEYMLNNPQKLELRISDELLSSNLKSVGDKNET